MSQLYITAWLTMLTMNIKTTFRCLKTHLSKIPQILPCVQITRDVFGCLHIGFAHPGNQLRAVIRSIINISQRYGREETNVAPEKRHIVVQCNNVFNKAIISHSETEGNQHNRHAVKMFRPLTKQIL